MKPLPPWQRPERWLAFVLTFLGVCSFLAIVPVSHETRLLEEAAGAALSSQEVSFMDTLREGARELRVNGHWTSLLPPLIAVMVAAFFRTLVGALVTAWVAGSLLAYGLNPLATAVLGTNDFLIQPATGQFSALVILFLFSLVGMVQVMSRSGGLSGLVGKMGKVANSRRRAKVAIGLGGLFLFFDDYSNAVVLGTTMQKLSDRWKIAREKLAYLVDSTTAPVAGLALLSTWVAFEVYLLGDVSVQLDIELSGYGMLVEMLPMRFYCIGTLIFLFLNSATGRDFGPMLHAERRAFREGKLIADEHQSIGIQMRSTEKEAVEAPDRWYNAVVPILVLIVCIVAGIVTLGAMRMESSGDIFWWLSSHDWRAAFSAAVFDPSGSSDLGAMPVLFASALIAGLVAVAMPAMQGVLSVAEAVSSYARALPTMWMAVFILVMTWSMREICHTLGTADYLIAMMGDSMPVYVLPVFAFFLAAGMSFATGSSWGAMGILLPIVMPLAVQMGATQSGELTLYLLTAAAILDGAIFGDHCSPISDTTVLSSISTGCDHLAHVNTQLYYALVTVALACVFGYLMVGNGISIWAFYILFPITAFAVLRLLGERSDLVEVD
ncbi:Na+/H+ antiporter NhaC family protein [Pelagicoccus sp. SDUM812003]|uniref:Na+/H+ antiporter NhaC family protein n=1 Tax=Pelagicoccus sp. SDUM812003 TaxID=3041267 RepID=UPI0028107272|nr:Na+/H+ antiporter NhaC family protein [Pelagicoccus sp. SDUM812003]MDQ8202296.1 Na+/H+ antiporter NhaC family protein [Pelagicoccus sp. SDUM812003]